MSQKNADSLKAEFTGNFACEYPAPLVKALIDNQPAADVAEIVRCKDCKHWHGGDCFRIELTGPNDFCSFGEKIKESRSDKNDR